MRWEQFEYESTQDGIRIINYVPETEEESVRIPAAIGGTPVTVIGAETFSENGALLSRVEVPPTVRVIGDGAFRMCLTLTELILHEGLEDIGEGALALTPLTEVTLPDTVVRIGAPWELGNIRFLVSEKNPHFRTDGFCLYQNEGKGKTLLMCLQTDERESYGVAAGTTAIGESAFAGNEALCSVTLPDTVRTIGEAAFESCQNLTRVELPEGLRTIEANAFGHCILLQSIHLPSTLETIGDYALSDTFGWSEALSGLERVTVEAGNAHFVTDEEALFARGEDGRHLVKYFGEGGLYRVPEGVTRILPGALRRAKFYRCEIPASVRSVGRDAFRECKNLREILLRETDTTLYIPGQPIYRKDEVTNLFFAEEKKEGPIYDYAAYDALFFTYRNLPDKCGMACCRLTYPVSLSEKTAQGYRAFVTENMPAILQGIADRQDMEQLVQLTDLGFFTGESLELGLELFGQKGRTKLSGYLLNYKREHMQETAFDFTL